LSQKGFERIVIAVDGSENSLMACKATASLAVKFKSEVTLLHVIPSGGFKVLQRQEVKDQLEQGAKKQLEMAASLIEREGLKVTKETLYAHPSVVQSIVNYANERNSDLIALGTRGIGGFQKMLLGSVSNGVATHSQCSVLIVRPSSPAEEPRFRSILVAIDGSEKSARAARTAAEVARATGAELTVVHVVHLPSYAYEAGSAAAIQTMEKDEREYGQKLLQDAASIFKQEGVNAKLELMEEIQSPAVRITKYAASTGTDLIVIGARGVHGFERLLLGSVAIGVLNYSHCSVMVVR